MGEKLDLNCIQQEIWQQAKEFGQSSISCEIALYAFLKFHTEEVAPVFSELKCDTDALMRMIERKEKRTRKRDGKIIIQSAFQRILKQCDKNMDYIRFTGLLLLEGGIPYYYFGLSYPEFFFQDKIKEKFLCKATVPGSKQETHGLKIDHCTDMTYLAAMSDEPFFGREEELEQMIMILLCRKKNNVLLLGEAGVGKTALAEALAKKISSKEVPEELWNSRLFSLNLASLIGGASGRGEFEERVEKLFQQIEGIKEDVILFIDEFHSIIGLGNDGSFDFANLLKPVLARKKVKCIGATTFREYKIYVEKDGALVRRFTNISVLEPSKEQTYQILYHVKKTYEDYHKVSYQNEAIRVCVDLADKYVKNRQFPDKALDIMDEAGVLAKRQKKTEIMPEMIIAYISRKYKVPLLESNDSSSSAGCLLKEMLKPFIGNELEKEKLLKYLMVSQFMMQEENLCNCVLQFTGAKDCAKENFIKAVRLSYFPVKEAYLELDLSTYQEKHTISRLIGAPPGYVGSQESGILVDKLKHFPRFLLVIRNAEAAHPDIIEFLKKVIQGSIVTDIWGNGASMRNAMVILDQCKDKEEKVCESGLDNLSFGTITFHTLSMEELGKAAKAYLKVLSQNLKRQNIRLFYDNSVMVWVKECMEKEQKEETLRRDICRCIIETISEAFANRKRETIQLTLYYINKKLEVSQGGREV